MRFEKTIRLLPPLFLGVAGINFIRAIFAFAAIWLRQGRVAELDGSHAIALSSTFASVESAIVVLTSPLLWIAWEAALSVLLAIYDRVSS